MNAYLTPLCPLSLNFFDYSVCEQVITQASFRNCPTKTTLHLTPYFLFKMLQKQLSGNQTITGDYFIIPHAA